MGPCRSCFGFGCRRLVRLVRGQPLCGCGYGRSSRRQKRSRGPQAASGAGEIYKPVRLASLSRMSAPRISSIPREGPSALTRLPFLRLIVGDGRPQRLAAVLGPFLIRVAQQHQRQEPQQHLQARSLRGDAAAAPARPPAGADGAVQPRSGIAG